MSKIDLKSIIGKTIKIKDDDIPDRTYQVIGYNLKEKTVIFIRVNRWNIYPARVHVKYVEIVRS